MSGATWQEHLRATRPRRNRSAQHTRTADTAPRAPRRLARGCCATLALAVAALVLAGRAEGGPPMTATPPAGLTPCENAATNLWGYCDAVGAVVIPQRFVIAGPFSPHGLAPAVDDHWQYIDTSGREVIRPVVVDNGPDEFREGFARFVADERIGFFDETGAVVIPPTFTFARPFAGGRAAFCVACEARSDGEHTWYEGGRWGFIDRSGNIAIAPSFAEVDDFGGGTALVRENETWRRIDPTGARAGQQPTSLHRRRYTDALALAQAACNEIARLEADPSATTAVAALLADPSVIFAGDPEAPAAVRAVTARDMAFTILEEIAAIELRGDTGVKLIAGCDLHGEWTRLHVRVLDEDAFVRARATLGAGAPPAAPGGATASVGAETERPCVAASQSAETVRRPAILRLSVAGALDARFGASGIALDPDLEGGIERVLPDGDAGVSVLGYPPTPANDIFIARFGRTGVLDPSFATGGIRRLDHDGRCTSLLGGGPFGWAVRQADGRIIVAQPCSWVAGEQFRGETDLRRIESDGAVDPAYGGKGVVRLGLLARDIVEWKNGRLLVAGEVEVGGVTRSTLAALDRDGAPDPRFGAGGRLLADLDFRGMVKIVAHPSGPFVVLAEGRTADAPEHAQGLFAIRGDLTEPKGSVALFPPRALATPTGFRFGAAALAEDGALLVAGRIGTVETNVGDVAVLRFSPDGERDPTFGDDGVAILRADGAFAAGTLSEGATALLSTRDGIFVGFSVFGGDRGFTVWKLLANGRSDPAFGAAGVRIVPIGSVAELRDLAWDPASRTLTAGGWSMPCAIAHR